MPSWRPCRRRVASLWSSAGTIYEDGAMDAPDVTIATAVEVLSTHAMEVRQRFAAFENNRIGREWTTAEIMSGFVVDVGDLTRLVMAATGARHVDDLGSKLEHELADCLWSLLVLAKRLDVDLAQAFEATMRDLTAFLDAQTASPTAVRRSSPD